jgi:uncharacterized protein (DUF1330 family)
MSVYMIAQLKINDPETFHEYVKGFSESFREYKGEVILVDNNPKIIEGSCEKPHTVVFRFPDEEEFQSWYNSTKYQNVIDLRLQSADTNMILVREGVNT